MSLNLPPLLLVTLYLVATYRVTRVVTRDKLPIVCVPRDRFVERWGVYEDADDRRISISGKQTDVIMASLAYLWECDWCASIWVGTLLGYLTWQWPGVMAWVLLALAASAVTGWLANLEVFLDKKTEKLK